MVNGVTGATGAISQAILLGGSLGIFISDAGFGIQGTSLGFAPAFIQYSASPAATNTIAFVSAQVGGTNDQCVIQSV